MGKHVVYVKERAERELMADGLDPSTWVREIVKAALEERALAARTGVPPHPVVREPRSSSADGDHPTLPTDKPSALGDVKPDFKRGEKKK